MGIGRKSMFDLKSVIFTALAVTAGLQPVILALVTYYARWGAKGRVQLALSLLTGFVLGVIAMTATLGFPTSYAGWVALAFYGLIPGLVASGVYETGKGIATRAVTK
jgi:hypothetical protein